MDLQKQREIASEGGRAAPCLGNAHEFDAEQVRRAGSMSHKNEANDQSPGNNSDSGSIRAGSCEQHAEAESQSQQNDKR